MFEDKTILDARFTNEQQDTIAVVYRDEESGENVETYVQVNDEDYTYKQLVEAGFSAEVILDRTAEAKRIHMKNVYETLKAQHLPQHEKIMAELERDKQEKMAEVREAIQSLTEPLELKRQQFLIAIAAIEALKKVNKIKSAE